MNIHFNFSEFWKEHFSQTTDIHALSSKIIDTIREETRTCGTAAEVPEHLKDSLLRYTTMFQSMNLFSSQDVTTFKDLFAEFELFCASHSIGLKLFPTEHVQ